MRFELFQTHAIKNALPKLTATMDRWVKTKAKIVVARLALCLMVTTGFCLVSPTHLNVRDMSKGRAETILIPATYEPIVVPVRITAYNPLTAQTDETPFIMASGRTVYSGAIALSRDLESDLDLKFGDRIEIDGLGHFVFEDRMHRRWKRTVDILIFSPEQASRFGVQYSFLRIH
jgi:hypothetical protein